MPDYDKIIEHLWEAVCVPHYDNAGNAWEYPKKVQDAAYAAIEAIDSLTTSRVMTLEEVKQHDNKNNCVWFELPNNIIAAVFVIQDRTQTGIISPYVNSEPLIFHLYWNNTNYGKTWRCWTAKPTDEQRKAVKWDE